MSFKRLIVWVMLLPVFTSCQKKRLTAVDYVNQFRNPSNGFISEVTVDSVHYKANLFSREYMALVGIGDAYDGMDQTALDSAINQTEDLTYVVLEFSDERIHGKIQQTTEEVERLLNNDLPAGIKLVSDKTEIPCTISNPQMDFRNGYKTLWLGFSKPFMQLEGPLTLHINAGLISQSPLDINFSNYKNSAIPQLIPGNL